MGFYCMYLCQVKTSQQLQYHNFFYLIILVDHGKCEHYNMQIHTKCVNELLRRVGVGADDEACTRVFNICITYLFNYYLFNCFHSHYSEILSHTTHNGLLILIYATTQNNKYITL